MIVTREIQAAIPEGIQPVVDAAASMRADIWRRYGALGTTGKTNRTIRTEILKSKIYHGLDFGYGTLRNETMLDAINDIFLYKAAAKEKTRKDIFKRTGNKGQAKEYYTLLKSDKWLDDRFTHRRMRKHFRHGISKANNQFVVRNDGFSCEMEDGILVIYIKQTGRDNIKLVTTTSGKNVNLAKKNLRIIVEEKYIRICYAFEKNKGHPCGTKPIGVDKGYTEALVTSDAKFHGTSFGNLMTTASDQQNKTGKARNKLYTLAKKYKEQGKHKKARNIKENNLGKQKLNSRRILIKQQLRDIAYKSAHQVIDVANVVVSEDLTSQFSNKHQWRNFNRRMSSWAKGVLAEALDSVCSQRGAHHVLVNAAYTSQMDSTTGLLTGKRVGDKFHRNTGDVIQADVNAARNVLARLHDQEIGRYMKAIQVKKILLGRALKHPAEQTVNGISCSSGYQQCADNPFILDGQV